jgi:hypothetical protein
MLRFLPLIAIILLVIGIIAAVFISPKSKVSISGTIDLNGTPPPNSTISILAEQSGEYDVIIANISASDGAAWQWNSAKSGQNYNLKLQLLDSNNQPITTTNPQVVTAPASSVALRLNYTPPESTAPVSATPTSVDPIPAFITGNIDLNGYIPEGSTITLQQQLVGATNYQTFGTPFSAADKEEWVWKEAVTNQQYNIQAVLVSNTGLQIGKAQLLNVSAPAANETIIINSTATPPTTTNTPSPSSSTIFGTINLNGVVPSGASIVILAATPGTSNYQTVVSGISPTNGATWSWTTAQTGVAYQMVAVLKNSSLADISVSSAQTITSPAANESFMLNSNASLPAPANLPSITCNTKTSATNSWSATINYPAIPGAQTYWLQLGTTSGASDMINVTQGSSTSVYVTTNATLNDSVSYYAQYAYSMSPGVAMGSNFSAMSPSQVVHCP